MKNSLYHPKNDFEGTRSHNSPTKLYALALKQYILVILLHEPILSYMRSSFGQGLFAAIIQLQPLPSDDSLVSDVHSSLLHLLLRVPEMGRRNISDR